MPYIKKEKREYYDGLIDPMIEFDDKGQLEYCIFKLMKMYMSDKDARYDSLHDCTYAVQHCADEFRRRYLDKREDDARRENGDIE